MKILIFSLLLSFILCGPFKYKGMMVGYKKDALANDILYLFERQMLNLKSLNFSDIKVETNYGDLKDGRYITDIKINTLNLKLNDLLNSAKVNEKEKTLVMLSNKDDSIKNVLTFNWRIMALNLDIAYGSGKAEFSTKKLNITVAMPMNVDPKNKRNLSIEINADFNVNILAIDGIGTNDEIKAWIKNQLEAKSIAELKNATKSNTLIKKNLFKAYRSLDSIIYDTKVWFKSVASNTETDGKDNLWVAFSTIVGFSENRSIYSSLAEKTLQNPIIDKKISVYLSSEIIEIYLDNLKNKTKLSMKINTRDFGYTGNVTDYVAAVPELALRFNRASPANVNCMLEDTQSKGKSKIDANMKCNYSSNDINFLRSKAQMSLRFIPGANAKGNFIAKVKDSSIKSIETIPSTIDAGLFISQLLVRYKATQLNKDEFNIPNIKYEPLRDPKSYGTNATEDFYSISYDY